MCDRVHALDGLRGLAVLAVMLFHSGFRWVHGGWLGVDVFFVLSGYLITGILLSPGWTWRSFLWRRMTRLYPALLVCVTVVGAATATAGLTVWAEAAGAVYLTTPLVLFGVAPLSWPSWHLWSLAVEAQFYAAWGMLMLSGRRWPRHRLAAACLALAAASMAGKVAILVIAHDWWTAYAFTPVRVEGLLFGAAVAAGLRLPTKRVALACAASFLAAAVVATDSGHPVQALGITAAVVATGTAIAAIRDGQAPWLAASLSSAALTWLGVRSYSLYLWHWPVFYALAGPDGVHHPGPWILGAWPIAIALAWASHRWVEVPAQAWLRGRPRTLATV